MDNDTLRTLLEASPFVGTIAVLVVLLRWTVPPIIDAYTKMRMTLSEELARREKEHAQDRAALAAVGARWSESSERMLATMGDMVQQLGTYSFSHAAMENDLKKALSNIEGLERQLTERDRTISQLKAGQKDMQARIEKLEHDLEQERKAKKAEAGSPDGNPPASG